MIADLPLEGLVTLLDGLPILVCGLERDGRIVAANAGCVELAGDVLGRDWREVFATHDRADHVAALWTAVQPGVPSDDFEALCGTHRVRWRFSHWDLAPRAALCAIGLDVTQERARMARKRSADRVAALGNLGAGLAHELRNPLNSAVLQLALAERRLAKTGDPSQRLDAPISEAKHELSRAAALLDDFLAFARPSPMTLEQVDIHALVERAVQRTRPRAHEAGVSVEVARGDGMLCESPAELDAVRVEGALVQLIANAIDASARAHTPVLVRCYASANTVALEVEDRGPGLPSKDAPIFDPFYTTKPASTGLGLAIVERVAADHGGHVEVERVGDATIFRMRLPIIVGAV